jgi:hypothetical protein
VSKPYKIAAWGNASYHIRVPKEIAEVLPREIYYRAELTDDGILLRPTHLEPPAEIVIPEWAAVVSGTEQ